MIDTRLADIFSSVLSRDMSRELSLDSDTESVSGWDSQTYVALLLGIETTFAVTLSTLDAARMSSIRSIYEVLREKGVSLPV